MDSLKFKANFKTKSLCSCVTALIITAGSPLANANTVLEELVVTAQKRSENIQDVPASISAFSASDMEKMQVSTINDIAPGTVNLNVISPFGEGGSPLFSLRGITASDYSQNHSRPIALYVDEGIRGLSALEIVQFYDIERVEVLRGPQGTLYGKNATGGAINVYTKKPGFETEGYLKLGVGNYKRRAASGAIQTGLIDDLLAARFAFTSTKTDGYVENKFPGGKDQNETDVFGARFSLLYTPTKDLEAVLRFHYAESGGEEFGVLAENIDGFLGVTRAGLDFHENEAQLEAERDIENKGVSLNITYDLSDRYSLMSVTTYDEAHWFSPNDDDGLPISVDENNFDSENIEHFVQELRLTSNYDGNFNWMAGLSYGYDETDMTNILRLLNEPALGVPGFRPGAFGFNVKNSFRQERESFAAFVRGDYQLNDVLSLSLGVRYSEDELDLKGYNAALGDTLPGMEAEFFIPTIVDVSANDSWESVTTEATLNWTIQEDMLAYFKFSQGYRMGAANSQAFFAALQVTTVEPEEVDSFEIGLKATLLGGRMQANMAAFFYDYTDQQFLSVEPPAGLQVLNNAEKAEVKGIEFTLKAAATESLTLDLGVGYLEPEYKDLSLNGVDLSGNQIIYASEWNINASADWIIAQMDVGELRLNVGTSFQSEVFFEAPNRKTFTQDDYWVTNARLGFESQDGRYSVALWGKNIFDKEYVVFGFDTKAFGLGFDFFQRGLPRTFGADFTINF